MNTTPDVIDTLYRGALTLSRAQAISGIDRRSIMRAISEGKLLGLRPPGTSRWRIPEQALRDWLAAGARPPGEK